MPAKHPKRPRDLNQWAQHMVAIATGTASDPDPAEGKDPAAVALGRKGGLKGGKVRAKNMTKKQRSESAKKAADARWGKKI